MPATKFDFRKLIRICEEINSSYSGGSYLGTAMLTRGLLDHVPPIFGKATFNEVANHYSGGGRSFKETMHHLENASRKIDDAHLIRLLRIAVESAQFSFRFADVGQHKSSVGTRNLAEGPAAAAAAAGVSEV
jgi:hypothetical protein